MTTITVHEIRYGIELRPSSRRRRNLERNFQDLLAAGFGARLLPFDKGAAEVSATSAARHYRDGRPVGLADTQIAGIAVSRNAAVATHNARHFSDLPIPVIDLGAESP